MADFGLLSLNAYCDILTTVLDLITCTLAPSLLVSGKMTSTPPQLSPSGTNETFAETDPDSRLDTPRDRGSIDSGITTSSRSSLLSISERSSFSSHSQQSCLEPRRQTNQYTTSSHYLQPIPIEKDTSTKRPRLGHTSYLPLLASLAASAEAATIVPTRQIRQKRYWETIGIEEESLAENGRGKRGMRGPGSGSGSGSGTNQGHRVGLDQEVCSYHTIEQRATDSVRVEPKPKPHSPFLRNIEVYTDHIESTPNRTESIQYPDPHLHTDAQIIHIHPESLFSMISLLRTAVPTQIPIPLQIP
jgi:hypothetical protein